MPGHIPTQEKVPPLPEVFKRLVSGDATRAPTRDSLRRLDGRWIVRAKTGKDGRTTPILVYVIVRRKEWKEYDSVTQLCVDLLWNGNTPRAWIARCDSIDEHFMTVENVEAQVPVVDFKTPGGGIEVTDMRKAVDMCRSTCHGFSGRSGPPAPLIESSSTPSVSSRTEAGTQTDWSPGRLTEPPQDQESSSDAPPDALPDSRPNAPQEELAHPVGPSESNSWHSRLEKLIKESEIILEHTTVLLQEQRVSQSQSLLLTEQRESQTQSR